MGHCNSFKCLAILTFICAGVSVTGWVLHVVGLALFIHARVSSEYLFDYTGPDSLPIWAVAVGTPLGIVATLVQTLLTIFRVKNKVAIMVWSPIFIVLMSFPMVFSIELIYKIGGYFYPVHYPANAIYFSGLLIIAVFEDGALILLVMLMQWKRKRNTTVPIASEGAINSSQPI